MNVTAADLLLYSHFLYVMAVVLPVPVIVIGAWRGWRFVSNPWFRFIHLGMILVVVVQSALGYLCPLTVWEFEMRYGEGGVGPPQSQPARLIYGILYYDLDLWVFAVIYASFGAVVLSLFYFVPVRLGKSGGDCPGLPPRT